MSRILSVPSLGLLALGVACGSDSSGVADSDAGATGGTSSTGGTSGSSGGNGTSGGSSSAGGSNTPGTGGSNTGTGGANAGTGGTSSGGSGSGGTGSGTGGAPQGGDGGTPSDDGGAVSCTDPVFTTSDTNGGWSVGGYYVHNNMWNSSVTLGPETLYACSYDNWYVVSNQTNEAGAVKTYPNVHKNYDNVPIVSFNTITSTFAAESPHVGIYNVAFDIWTNGIATSGSTEFMIWTENHNQVPAGNEVATVEFGGRTYDVWKTSNNHYIAFVATEPILAGTIDLLEIMRWATDQGWFPADSTLGQIGYGVEIVSTEGRDATFYFTDFSITSD